MKIGWLEAIFLYVVLIVLGLPTVTSRLDRARRATREPDPSTKPPPPPQPPPRCE